MRKFLRKLWTEEKAENVPEYALLLFLVSLTAVSTMTGVASKVNSICSTASIHMKVASNPVLVSGSMGYTSEAPANLESKVKEDLKQQSSR